MSALSSAALLPTPEPGPWSYRGKRKQEEKFMVGKDEVREFLISRRANVTPEQAGIPHFGGERRAPGLRREEVAMLAGVSLDYYTRLERGNIRGASESVLEAIARALQLNDVERAHLFDLARNAPAPAARSRKPKQGQVRASVRRVLDNLTIPAVVHNVQQDLIGVNLLGRALYTMHFEADRPNMARFDFLEDVLAVCARQRVPESQRSEWLATRRTWIREARDQHGHLLTVPLLAVLLALVCANASEADVPKGRATLLHRAVEQSVQRWEH